MNRKWDPKKYVPESMLRRASCAYYAQGNLFQRDDPKDSNQFIISSHHTEWDNLVSSSNRICVLAPRDHGKSAFFDFAYPIWQAEHHPRQKGYIFSATMDQAVRILSDIKDEIEDNPRLRHLLPEKRDVWNATAIKLANGHRIYARGYGTKIRGAHPQWIVVDDGLNDEDAYSEVVRNKHIDYFYTAITNMIVPGGQIIVVGTPFHASDLYSSLSTNPEYVFRKYPAIRSDGTALWPGRYSVAALAAKRREIGSVRFTREFLVEPISDDMSLFPSSLFLGSPVEQFQCKLGMPIAYWRSRGIRSVYIGVDLAISASTGADWSVIFVLGVDGVGNRWVLDIIRRQGLPFNQQLGLIHSAAKRYDADLIFIESNQMQRVFGDELIRTSDLPIHKFVTTGSGKGAKHPGSNTTTANKNSLEGGVPALRVLLENQKVRIPRGDRASIEATDAWIAEMRSFTWLDGKLQGVGAKDDTVMAFWIADQAVRQGGFTFSTGDDGPAGSVDEFLKELSGSDEDEEDDEEPEDRGGISVGTGHEEMEDVPEGHVIANLVGEDDVRSAPVWQIPARFK